MATAPPWGFDLQPLVRNVLVTGITTRSATTIPPLDDEAWTSLRAHAARHRLSGLLVGAVASDALAASPGQCAETAELELELTEARMWHQRRLAEIVEPFAAAGIVVRVLKGPALASLDYPDAQWRPTGDVDLLVRADDIDRADELLASMGGLRTDPDPADGFAATVGKGATIAMPDGLEVDLHRLLVWGPLGVRLPAEELWTDSRSFTWGAREYQTLTVEDTLLHACAHLLVLGWRRALTLRDVAQVLRSPELDPDLVINRARRQGAEALLATGVLLAQRELALADDAFGSGSLVVEWARGYPVRWRDRLWLRVERPDDPVGALETAATYLELRTSAERRVLRDATFRPRPGTYEPATARAKRVLGRNLTALSRTAARR